MRSSALLIVDCIWKAYRSEAEELGVLRGASLRLDVGDSAVVTGASGSGKSTLLNLVGGLDHVDAGTITVGDVEVTAVPEKALASFRRRLGMVFQFHHLLRDFTAYENVQMPLLIAGARRAVAGERATQLIDAVGLTDRATHYPHELSGGERQRVSVARALAVQPDLVLADEPTGNLDERNASDVGDLLFGLAEERGVTLLVVTHDRNLAARARQLFHLEHGQLQA